MLNINTADLQLPQMKHLKCSSSIYEVFLELINNEMGILRGELTALVTHSFMHEDFSL